MEGDDRKKLGGGGVWSRKMVSRRRGKERVLVTMWLGKEVMEKVFGYHVVRNKGDESYKCDT
jgi:hypothetical protein